MLVPGFEGHHEVFTSVCERLKVQAVAIQYGPEHINANVSEMAANIKKVFKIILLISQNGWKKFKKLYILKQIYETCILMWRFISRGNARCQT